LLKCVNDSKQCGAYGCLVYYKGKIRIRFLNVFYAVTVASDFCMEMATIKRTENHQVARS